MTVPTSSAQEIGPERPKEVLDDNARKFTLAEIDETLLNNSDSNSYLMITDWLETNESEETKVVYKRYDNGEVLILLITKVTKDGGRTSEKTKITEKEYSELVIKSKVHSEKVRTEFTYPQHGIDFSIKFDQFTDNALRILEVDASSDKERAAFDYHTFPAKLSEVTGNLQYYGFRVAGLST
jgi:hypothetical protein